MSYQLKFKTCQNDENSFPPVGDDRLQELSASFRKLTKQMEDMADQYNDAHLVEVVMMDLDTDKTVDKQVVQCRHQKP